MRKTIRLKYFLISLVIHITAQNLHAQTIAFAPKEISTGGYDHLKIIGEDEEGFYLLQSNLSLEMDRDHVGFKSRKYKISYLNNNLELKWSKPIAAPNSDAAIDAIACADGKVLVVSGQMKKNENKFLALVKQYNNLGAEDGDLKTVAAFDFDKDGELEKIKVVLSADQKRIAFVLNEVVDNKQVEHFAICDSSLKNIQTSSFQIPYREKDFSVNSFILSNEGDFIMLGTLTSKDKQTKKEQNDYKLYVSRFGENPLNEFQFTSSGKTIAGLDLAFDNIHQQVMIGGFYAEKTSFSGSGVMLASLDMKNPAEIAIKMQPINDGTKNFLIGERNSGDGMGLLSYEIQKLILRNDGGAVIIAEASYTQDYSYFDYFTQSYMRRTEYHYNNVVILSVNADATIDWHDVIRKDQESQDDYGLFSSFCSMLNQDEIIILYNSDISRMNEVVAYSINNKGEHNINKLVRADDHVLLLPHAGRQISGNEIIIPAWQKRSLTIAKITF